jgi:hypothetical protein
MKSILTFCFGGLLLAGCANPDYWDHGEWLDHVSVRPEHPVQHSDQEQQALQSEADQLRAQAEAIRVKLASEKSRDERIAQMKQLKDIGDNLRPVENALQGGPIPYRGLPIPQPGDAGGAGS